MSFKLSALPFSILSTLRNSFLGRAIGKCDPLLRILKPLYNKMDIIFFRLYWKQGDIVEVQGSKMFVDVFYPEQAMRHTFRHYALYRIHEPTTTDLFRKAVHPGDIVLDIGANIGYFTLLASKLVGDKGKVYSFEPEPRNYGYLCKNISLNHYQQTKAFQKAVSNQPGSVKLFLCPYDTGHHTIQQFGGIRSYNPQLAGDKEEFVDVETVRIDDFLQSEVTQVNVIKMDVEGAELLAIGGMERILTTNENLIMFIEFFPMLIKNMGQDPQEFLRKIIMDFEFIVFIIGDDYSMKGQKSEGQLSKVSSVKEIMHYCKNEIDHLNLLLVKGHPVDRFEKY